MSMCDCFPRSSQSCSVESTADEPGCQYSNRPAKSKPVFLDDWFDPLIGLRGRYNLSKAFYLTAETDIGGFGIGSDIAWQGYAALGCQIIRNIYSEVGYRALYDDFRDESDHNFLYQIWLQGQYNSR